MDSVSLALTGASTTPLVRHQFEVPGSNIRFSAACFGSMNDREWSLGPLQWPEDAAKNTELAQRLGVAIYNEGASHYLAPNPTLFNGEFVSPEKLDRHIPLPAGPETVWLHRNQNIPADATFLPHSGYGGGFSAGGCGVTVLAFRDKLMFGHSGRESLIDRVQVLSEGRMRSRPRDLVDNMLMALGATPHEMNQVYAWPLYFISPEHFNHPKDHPDPQKAIYGETAIRYFPSKYREFGWLSEDGRSIHIDLAKIAREQLTWHGVPRENVFLEHSALDKELPTTRNGGGRYLVAIVRH